MKRKLLLILAAIMLSSLAGCGEEEVSDMVEVVGGVEHNESYVLENEELKLVMDGTTTQFTLEQKDEGYIWYSNPKDAESDPLANGENKNQLLSTLILQYTTSDGNKVIMSNYEYSISRGLYEIHAEDDVLSVTYSIGDVSKDFIFPLALTEERMNVFLEKMDSFSARQINEYYRKYDINNLRSTDNKEELLAQYPDMENEIVYVLRDGIPDNLKEKVETLFAEAGYTYEDYEKDSARYSSNTVNEKPVFSVTLEYQLEGDELVVSAPIEKMDWKKDYPMTKLTILPYMGAGGTTDEGYMLVPDGSGGIIDFNNGKQTQSAFYADVYGWDYAVKRDAVINETSADYPVFGISNNGQSLLCVLEDNCSLATIEADVSGRNNSYNKVYASYQPVHAETMDVSARSDKTVMIFEAEKPEGSFSQRYLFHIGEDYVDMAIAYREYLQERYPQLQKISEADGRVNIELLGAIDKVEQRFGIPTSVSKALTTFEEAEELLADMQNAGFERMNLTYTGWLDGGIKHEILTNTSPEGELGSKKELKAFAAAAEAAGANLFLDGVVQTSYENGLFDGFMRMRDSAKYVTREVTELFDFTFVWYGALETEETYYLLKPQLSVSLMSNLADAASKVGSVGVSYNDVGRLLSADYNPKNYTSRQEVLKLQQEALLKVGEADMLVSVNGGNDYSVPYVDRITNMQLDGNGYLIIDREVPFYQMAIHGLVSYAGTSVNLSADVQQTLLESAKTGADLSFTFMKEDSSILQDSSYTEYYGAEYEIWREQAAEIYKKYYADMKGLANQFVVDYEELKSGVTVTEFEDGTKVYVNTNNYDYISDTINVGAREYLVEKGGK